MCRVQQLLMVSTYWEKEVQQYTKTCLSYLRWIYFLEIFAQFIWQKSLTKILHYYLLLLCRTRALSDVYVSSFTSTSCVYYRIIHAFFADILNYTFIFCVLGEFYLYMIWYDIYLLQLVFHPVTEVDKLVQKWKKGNYIQKEKQYTKQYKSTEYTK
jgi:hypothetical protein